MIRVTGMTSGGQQPDATRPWWAGLRGPDGGDIPPSVVQRLTWYEGRVRKTRRGYQALDVLVVVCSAAIPAAAAAGASATVAGVLGALVVVVAGMRQIFRWGENWIRASGVVVALQGEVVSWSRGVAPYDDPANADTELAIRAETLVQSETAQWTDLRQSTLATAPPAPPVPPSTPQP